MAFVEPTEGEAAAADLRQEIGQDRRHRGGVETGPAQGHRQRRGEQPGRMRVGDVLGRKPAVPVEGVGAFGRAVRDRAGRGLDAGGVGLRTILKMPMRWEKFIPEHMDHARAISRWRARLEGRFSPRQRALGPSPD